MNAKINKRTFFLGLFSLGLCSSLLPSCSFARHAEEQEQREHRYSRPSFSQQDRYERQINSTSRPSQRKYQQGEIRPKRQQGLRINDNNKTGHLAHGSQNTGRWDGHGYKERWSKAN